MSQTRTRYMLCGNPECRALLAYSGAPARRGDYCRCPSCLTVCRFHGCGFDGGYLRVATPAELEHMRVLSARDAPKARAS